MARRARNLIPGLALHVGVHGHNGGAIAIDDVDRANWHEVLRAHVDPDLAIHAYLLLDDRFHLIVTPLADRGLAALIQAMGRSYARPFNRRHGRSGPLWQGRYRSAVIEPGDAMIATLLALEQWPVRLGLVESATQYRWSSARHHAGLRLDPFISDHASYWTLGNTPFEREQAYRARIDRSGIPAPVPASVKPAGASAGGQVDVDQPVPGTSRPLAAMDAACIEQALLAGRPIATPEYLSQLEEEHGVRFRVGRVGRPPG